MDLIAISDDASVCPQALIKVLETLTGDNTAVLPVFYPETVKDLKIVLNLFKPNAVIVIGSWVEHFGGKALENRYVIHITHDYGFEGIFLYLPDLNSLDWDLTEAALERFKELL